jgi:hypothetical protein
MLTLMQTKKHMLSAGRPVLKRRQEELSLLDQLLS